QYLIGAALRTGRSADLRTQVVRVVGERPAAVVGHHHQILEPHPADLALPEPGLDRYHVTGDERRAPRPAESRILVHPQPDAVPERELEALARVLAGARALRSVPGRLEDLAGKVV